MHRGLTRHWRSSAVGQGCALRWAARSTLLAGLGLGCNEPPAPAAAAPAPPTTSCACAGGFADLAERADPAVVFIETVQSELGPESSRGLGSGFIIGSDGLILTNNHVIRGAKEIVVVTRNHRLPARVVGSDSPTDLAALRVEASDLPALKLGDSARVRVGDWVIAIGNPFGLEHTVSAGIVSAKNRTRHDVDLDPAGYYNFLQTDASINPGNSGGPLLNLSGEVIGINTAIRAGANDIGFAIPIDMVKALLPHLLREGRFRRSALGVSVDSLAAGRARELGVQSGQGAVVTDVTPGGPGDRAGLRPGDILLAFDGQIIEGKESLRWLASIAGVGRAAVIRMRRGPRRMEMKVVLGALPELE